MFGSTLTQKEIQTALRTLYESDTAESQITAILQDASQWPLQLFVSPERENALSWHDFDPKAQLLDATNEYGSITGLLAQKCASAAVLFEGKDQKQTLQARLRTAGNVELIARNKLPNNTYDYIVISDLMWTWQDIKGNFELLLSALKPTGTVLLLANNRLGVQYLAGVADVYSGQLFGSVSAPAAKNPYGTRRGIQMFLEDHNFATSFFYPLPNYIFASEVFSEQHLETRDSFLNTESLPVAARYSPREYLFDEKIFFEHAQEAGILSSLANSFIVVGKRHKQ